MLVRHARLGTVLGLTLCTAGVFAACGGSDVTVVIHKGTGGSGSGGHGGNEGTGASGNGGSSLTLVGSSTSSGAGGSVGAGGATAGFDVEPSALQTITVTAGQTTPTVKYSATLDGVPISAGWGVDKGNIGAVTPTSGTSTILSPTGTTGGVVTVSAGLNGKTVSRQVLVKLTSSQNGATAAESGQIPTTVGQLTAGGGVGGVGGEGLGTPVTDMPTLTALGAPTMTGATQNLAFLYPYDKTVWPRGLLAPLVMWSWSVGDADAIQITLKTTTGSFSYTGTFAKPAILTTTKGNFIRMPIPQDVWDMATNTAGGASDQLTLGLTVAKSGVGYGPITQTWTIAEARLDGIIYYNSYGTQLVQNATGAVGGNGDYGGAVLSIHVGDTAPKVAAGTNAQTTGCRVCHSVAAGGSDLVVQHGDNYGQSSSYNLGATPPTETVLSNSATFPAMYPDGSMMLTPGGQLYPLPAAGAVIASTGLTAATNLGTPAFSPDGTKIVFNLMAGSLAGSSESLYWMAFDKTTSAFSGATLIAQDTAPARPGWPAFFPDSNSVVFENQSVAGVDGNGSGSLYTRKGCEGQIQWTSLAGPADGGASNVTSLDNLNGKGYLPKLATPSTLACTGDGTAVGAGATAIAPDLDHSDDVDHNYEPTVNPVSSGGYAWVVFTSRRMYGSEAAIPPFCSDPRGVNLITNITPKKLWVAAVDSEPGARYGLQPSGVLPAGAGAARGQLAGVLDAGSLPGGRHELHQRRSVLQRLLRAGGRGAGLLQHDAEQHLLRPRGQVHDGRRLLRHDQPVHRRVLLDESAAVAIAPPPRSRWERFHPTCGRPAKLRPGAGRLWHEAGRVRPGVTRLRHEAGRLRDDAGRPWHGAARLRRGATCLRHGAGRVRDEAGRLRPCSARLRP